MQQPLWHLSLFATLACYASVVNLAGGHPVQVPAASNYRGTLGTDSIQSAGDVKLAPSPPEKPGWSIFDLRQQAHLLIESEPVAQPISSQAAIGKEPFQYSTLWLFTCVTGFGAVVYAICGLAFGLTVHCLCIVVGALFGFTARVSVLKVSIYSMSAMPFAVFGQALYLSKTRSDQINVPFATVYGVSVFLGMLCGQSFMIIAAHDTSLVPVLEKLLLCALVMTVAVELRKMVWQPKVEEPAAIEQDRSQTLESGTLDQGGSPPATLAALANPQSGGASEASDIATGNPQDSELKEPSKEEGSKTRGLAWYTTVSCLSLFAGFFQGSLSVGGPTKAFMILLLNIGKDEWRASSSLADMPLQIVRIIILISFGMIDWATDGAIIGGIYVGTALGLVIGNTLSKHVSQQLFERMIWAIIVVSTLLLSVRIMHPQGSKVPVT